MKEERVFRFNVLVFLAAFAVGMMYVYINVPPVKYVLTYPTPYNAGNVVYKDAAGTCFVFDAKKVECPQDKKKIKQQPIVE
jgi:hypothetical protein